MADYFEMLALELIQKPYNKTAHRRALMTRLESRSERAIEDKHQNISAILLEENRPYIAGYKPLVNYQGLLREVVVGCLDAQPALDRLFESVATAPVMAPTAADTDLRLETPPDSDEAAALVREASEAVKRSARKVDFSNWSRTIGRSACLERSYRCGSSAGD
ncbi:MAG TPA: hypothetical protein VFY71_02345 [Planctomycetota bacterium]|nr:hypothetical protein [Planctomycetota bacterium]